MSGNLEHSGGKPEAEPEPEPRPRFWETALGEFLHRLLPVLCTLAVAIGSYYEARQAAIEARGAHRQSRQNWNHLQQHPPTPDEKERSKQQ